LNNIITKAAKVAGLKVTEEELKLINQYAIKDLTAEEVFTFKVAICDNEIDRDYEVFPTASLNKMAELYVGKTIISNHQAKSENQCARIYATEVVDGEGTTKNGEPYAQLVAHCYMVKTDSNKDLITEISAGIKKEVSVGCAIKSVVCSICGLNQRETMCKHWPSREYDGKTCYFKLEAPVDAYEVSFVAVPAQPKAGVTKSYGGEETKTIDEEDLIKLELVKSFIFINERKNNIYE
jgi:hypothetical protein